MHRYWKHSLALMAAAAILAVAGLGIQKFYFKDRSAFVADWLLAYPARAQEENGPAKAKQEFADKLVGAAIERTRHQVTYDPAYVVIPYPGGDVPDDRGVCSDVVVRSYRPLGIDLQKEVHEDMERAFSAYPKIWGLSQPDSNIDHRRVPNLMTFFKRHGETLPITGRAEDYKPGDIVCWDLNGRGLVHIGIVSDVTGGGGRYKVVHNVGRGPVLEDMLFDYKVIGHFRYYGPSRSDGKSE